MQWLRAQRQKLRPALRNLGILVSAPFRRFLHKSQARTELKTRMLELPEAVRNFRENRFARWYRSDIDVFDNEGDYACQRLRNKYFTPDIYANMKFRRTDSIFATGSCFARATENVLKRKGFNVESAATEFDEFEAASGKGTPLGFTNKYNTASIANELRWALVAGEKYPEDAIVDLADGTSIDPHINPSLKLVDRTATLHRRTIITEVTRRIKECQVFLMTLGLVEVWRDNYTGHYMNMTPIQEMQKKFPSRYSLHVFNYEDNLKKLNEIYEILTKYARSDIEIVVTVSPVPLLATCRGDDVVIANTYSKSTLRAVAEDWANRHSNTHYFPSYEIVMNSDRSTVWADDLRHVEGKIARHIMQIFIDNFVETPTSRKTKDNVELEIGTLE